MPVITYTTFDLLEEKQMLKRIGKIGAVMVGLVCLAPALLVLFGVAGVGWLPAYVDYILVLALALF